MSEQFAEYREISVTAPLRQGDVLEAVDVHASKWQRYLLILTADCDFAFDKHQGRVTCVPLLTADDYLLEMQIPKIKQRLINKAIGFLRRIVDSSSFPNISDERLRVWPREALPAEIATQLQLDPADAAVAQAALECIRLADLPMDTLDEAIQRLVEAHLSAPNPQKRENVLKEVMTTLKNPYHQPPGDALFLSALGFHLDGGYFAYLRQMEQVREADIAVGPTRHGAQYRRISRINDRFTHALAQRFALVFMSIGLPSEYEDIRDIHAELLGDRYK